MLQRLRTSKVLLILLSVVPLFVSGLAAANNAPNTVGPIPTQTVDMNTTTSTTLDLTTYFNDVDGDALTYTASSADTTIATVSVSDTTLTITPVAVGTVTITLTGTDPGGLSASHDFSLVVTKPNRAPVFSDLIVSTVDYPENATASVGSFVASDPDWDPNVFPPPTDLIYSVETTGDGDDFEFTDTSSPALYFKNSPDYENPDDSDTNNTYVVTVKVTDPGGLSDTHTVTVTVTDFPPPPKMDAPSLEVSLTRTMDVSWSAVLNTHLVKGYKVNHRITGSTGDGETHLVADNTKTSYTLIGLEHKTSYDVRVLAYNSEGDGTWSDPSSELTLPDPNNNEEDGNFLPADTVPILSSELAASLAERVAMDRVIFNELLNAAVDAHDWVELRNVTDTDINLNDWTLTLVTSENQQVLTLPAGTILPANSVILLGNTEGLILPQAPFTLILESPSGYADIAGNSFLGDATAENLAPLTVDQAWYRLKPAVIGYRAEAWIASPTAEGTPGQREVIVSDVNADGVVNILDLVLVASRIGGAYAPEADINGDGIVDVQDLVVIANAF